jgi:hypothetical protein
MGVKRQVLSFAVQVAQILEETPAEPSSRSRGVPPALHFAPRT